MEFFYFYYAYSSLLKYFMMAVSKFMSNYSNMWHLQLFFYSFKIRCFCGLEMVRLIIFLLHKHEALGLDPQTHIYDQALHIPLIPVLGSPNMRMPAAF